MKTKIIVLFISFFYFSLSLHAQIKKRSTSLGGQINFSHSQNQNNLPGYSDQIINNGFISLSAEKAIKENSLIGLNLQLGAGSNHYTTNITGKIFNG